MANRDLTGDTLRKVEMPPGRQERGMEQRQAGGHQAVGGSARAPRLQSLGHRPCRLPLERVRAPLTPEFLLQEERKMTSSFTLCLRRASPLSRRNKEMAF